MVRSRGTSPLRCLFVWASATVATGLLHRWLLPGLLDSMRTSGTARFADVLVAGCELAAVAAAGWLWVLVTLVVLDELRGRNAARTAVPAVVRRWVLAACGLTLATGLAVPAQADPGRQGPAVESLLAGLPVPDRMTATQWVGALARGRTPAAHRPAGSSPGRPGMVVVRAGDTLWDLAAADLPPGATDGDIAHRWRQIHAANRAVIGADPDLILPGQRLVLPDRDESR